MNQQLQQFIYEIVEATNLRGRIKKGLESELCLHISEKERELQLRGFSEGKIFEIVSLEFNKERMVQELQQVHNEKLKWRWMIMAVLVTIMVLDFMMVFFDSFVADAELSWLFRIFGWLGLILMVSIPSLLLPFNFITGAVIVLMFNLVKYILVVKNFTVEKSKVIRNFVVGGGLLLHWIALVVSFKSRHFPLRDHVEGGFPIKVFNFLWDFPPAVGPKWGIPLEPLPRYVIHLGIWTVIAVIIYRLLPEQMRESKKISAIILTGGLAATLFGFGFLSWQFED